MPENAADVNISWGPAGEMENGGDSPPELSDRVELAQSSE